MKFYDAQNWDSSKWDSYLPQHPSHFPNRQICHICAITLHLSFIATKMDQSRGKSHRKSAKMMKKHINVAAQVDKTKSLPMSIEKREKEAFYKEKELDTLHSKYKIIKCFFAGF